MLKGKKEEQERSRVGRESLGRQMRRSMRNNRQGSEAKSTRVGEGAASSKKEEQGSGQSRGRKRVVRGGFIRSHAA